MTRLRFRFATTFSVFCATLIAANADAQPARPDPGRFFERFDRNGDEVVDRAELEAVRRETFETADANGDDYLSGDEVTALGDGLRAQGHRGPVRTPMLERRGPRSAEDLLARLDADGDERVSEAEYVKAEDPLLRRLDGNRDGQITRDELNAARDRIRSQRRPRLGV